MEVITAIHSPFAVKIGYVTTGIHGMAGEKASLALSFMTASCGLSAGFHGTTAEMRAFAAELIRHADITDAKQAELNAEVVA
ncbi:hypothetical protein FHW84_001790 [Dyella sp. SG562]|uniref:hypothetical protein n=1 Tax=Dyella sp. SG562 TaxID=2587017 RepID=UPI0014241770|nr:hypothetical protein [Dyella sp. SG562]NII73221.1 hypothetical protein [Dyella sp. SG562]